MDNNGNQPAFATPEVDTPDYRHPGQIGLTKREYFAAMAMQGLCATLGQDNVDACLGKGIGEASVGIADQVLAALNSQTIGNG